MRTMLTCGQKAKQTHITRFVLICSRNFTITYDFVRALILLKKSSSKFKFASNMPTVHVYQLIIKGTPHVLPRRAHQKKLLDFMACTNYT